MHVSGNLVDWLENNPSIENFSATPYDDAHRPTPNATIGFGHKLHSGPVTEADRHKWANGISRFEAARLLRDDLRESEGEVNRDVKVPLRQSQFDSLVSLTFNIGADNFRGSALLRLLNDGDYLGAAAQFEAWTRSGSSHPRGLRTRRDEEKARFERR
jgi:lysozyme